MSDELTRIVPPRDKSFAFDFYFNSPRFEMFYLDEKLMKNFGVSCDAIVAVVAIKEIIEGVWVIAWINNELILSKVEFDESLRFLFITDNSDFPLPVIREDVIGKPFAYYPFDDIGNSVWNFKKLKND